jgi:heat shock protein HtpX
MTSMGAPSSIDVEALRRLCFPNWLHSMVLLLGLTALTGATGFLLAGTDALILAAALAAGFLLFNPVPGDAVFRYMYGAAPLTRASAPRLLALVGELAGRTSTAPQL